MRDVSFPTAQAMIGVGKRDGIDTKKVLVLDNVTYLS